MVHKLLLFDTRLFNKILYKNKIIIFFSVNFVIYIVQYQNIIICFFKTINNNWIYILKKFSTLYIIEPTFISSKYNCVENKNLKIKSILK